MPWLVRQPSKSGLLSIDDAVQAAGGVVTGRAAAVTGPLDRIHAPNWPGRLVATSVKVLPPAPVGPPASFPKATEMTVRSAGAKWGRIHSGMAIWRAAKTAMAGMVRRISAPAVTPRAKANAA